MEFYKAQNIGGGGGVFKLRLWLYIQKFTTVTISKVELARKHCSPLLGMSILHLPTIQNYSGRKAVSYTHLDVYKRQM